MPAQLASVNHLQENGLPGRGPQQYINGATAALVFWCGTECQYIMVLAQPVVQPVFQYRRLATGAVPLAMNDAHTADVLVTAAGDEVHQFITGNGDGHAMHIQFGTDKQAAAPELLQFSLLNSWAGEKQGLV